MLSAHPKESQKEILTTALTATIFSIFKASTKETTKRGGAAEGNEYSKYCNGQDSRQGISLGFLGTCRQQIQLEINLFFTVSASRERAESTF